MTTLRSDRPQRAGLTNISREALYDLVWTESVRTIAQRMGVSDVWLKKCCSKADIPVPDRGYWAKLRAGKTVVRRKLPPRSPGMATDLTIGTDGRQYWWSPNPEAELATPPPTEPTFAEPIEGVSVRVDKSLGKVRFVRDFGSAHNLIRHLLDEDELRRLKPSDAHYRLRYSDPFFDSPFERRRLRILNSLFLALNKAGYQSWLNDPQARNIGVTNRPVPDRDGYPRDPDHGCGRPSRISRGASDGYRDSDRAEERGAGSHRYSGRERH